MALAALPERERLAFRQPHLELPRIGAVSAAVATRAATRCAPARRGRRSAAWSARWAGRAPRRRRRRRCGAGHHRHLLDGDAELLRDRCAVDQGQGDQGLSGGAQRAPRSTPGPQRRARCGRWDVAAGSLARRSGGPVAASKRGAGGGGVRPGGAPALAAPASSTRTRPYRLHPRPPRSSVRARRTTSRRVRPVRARATSPSCPGCVFTSRPDHFAAAPACRRSGSPPG